MARSKVDTKEKRSPERKKKKIIARAYRPAGSLRIEAMDELPNEPNLHL